MIPDKLLLGRCKNFIRVIISQVTLEHERKFLHIRKLANVIRVDLLFFHPVVVKRRETVKPVHKTFHQFILHPLEIFFWHLLNSWIPALHYIASLRSITLFAFPSNRGREPGSTSLTVVRSSSASRSSFTTFFWSFARSASSPLKYSRLISTSTVISSR